MIRKYRKKPVAVEAVEFTADNWDEIVEFTNGKARGLARSPLDGLGCIIDTLEGRHIATEGDYIIKGVHGEFYPCKPDIFKEAYEIVEGEFDD